MMRKNGLFRAYLASATALLVTLLWWLQPQAPTQKSLVQKTPSIQYYTLEEHPYPQSITTYGQLKAEQQTLLKSPIQTHILAIPHTTGDSVSQGDSLISLDLDDLNLSIQRTQASIEQLTNTVRITQQQIPLTTKQIEQQSIIIQNASNQHQRLLTLKPQHRTLKELELAKEKQAGAIKVELQLTSQKHQLENQVNQASYQLKEANIALKQLMKQKKQAQITAPFNGFITEIHTSQGNLISPGQSLMTLINPQSFQIEALLPQSLIPALEPWINKPASILATAVYKDKTWPLVLSNINRDANQNFGTHGYFKFKKLPELLIEDHVLTINMLIPTLNKRFKAPESCFYQYDTVYMISPNNKLQPIKVKRQGHTVVSGQNYVLFSTTKIPNQSNLLKTRLAYPTPNMTVNPTS
ncbi:MAG TPA: HlyD family efflux transporter periplasmic adaptor subunit [Gammaproteobacteria bacterium]|nr:HlyD family efflux transporter periplasmic adaptor subunit [Gammaproteobacteria bacterium]